MGQKTAIQQWILTSVDGETFEAHVPGDITYDLYLAGKLDDPFYEMNYQAVDKPLRKDYTYTAQFTVSEIKPDKDYTVVFDGIDTFADIYLDGQLLGKTQNMFLQYRFPVTDCLMVGVHELKVVMHSTLNHMDTIDCKDYFGVFNVPRIFVRKAQCHFGWDWAPNLSGYGIWQDVYLLEENKYRLTNVNYTALTDGHVTFHAELNYNVRLGEDNTIAKYGKGAENKNDQIRVTLASGQTETVNVTGRKNILNMKVENVKLWYPVGYGKQPLYDYTLELIRDGEVVDTYKNRVAFRKVELIERPLDKERVGYTFLINGTEIFVKGSNWVPTECFTGIASDERYRRLIDQALDANINMLRIWGGGIYEKDIFYDLCDEKGILVWQDFMFACADIPEEDPAFVQNVLEECEYQIKRLRTHPCIIYWCGSNEKTGSYGLCVSHGDYLANIVLQGLVQSLDGTRPYQGQSPYSLTDVGNDLTTGECHYNSLEASLTKGIENYRSLVAERVVPFASECALMGPCSEESFKKFFGENTQWPMNEIWVDRLSDNPYSSIVLPFCQRQLKYVSELYNGADNLKEFVVKGMQVQAECLRAEVEFARANKKECSGILNWMYTDIWPTASWSIVDYYGEPKQAYYQMKRSFAPALATFMQNNAGKQELVLINDKPHAVEVNVEYGMKDFDGKKVWRETYAGTLKDNDVVRKILNNLTPYGYLYIKGTVDGEDINTVYSPTLWKNVPIKSDYSVDIRQLSDKEAEITVTAHKLAKSVYLQYPENCRFTYSDNYLDVDAGESQTVKVTCNEAFDATALCVQDFAKG